MLVTVNYAPEWGQCYVKLPFSGLGDSSWVLHDLIGGNTFEREGNELQEKGLYLDEPAWKTYVFRVERKDKVQNSPT
jgi:hypothetical protein